MQILLQTAKGDGQRGGGGGGAQRRHPRLEHALEEGKGVLPRDEKVDARQGDHRVDDQPRDDGEHVQTELLRHRVHVRDGQYLGDDQRGDANRRVPHADDHDAHDDLIEDDEEADHRVRLLTELAADDAEGGAEDDQPEDVGAVLVGKGTHCLVVLGDVGYGVGDVQHAVPVQVPRGVAGVGEVEAVAGNELRLHLAEGRLEEVLREHVSYQVEHGVQRADPRLTGLHRLHRLRLDARVARVN